MSANFWPVTLVDYAQIVGALATAAAVIVSLILAYRKPRPSLDVEVVVVCHVGQGIPKPFPEFLQIRVTNIGGSDAVLTSVGWCLKPRWLFGKPSWGHQDVSALSPHFRNPPLPVRLSHGEAVSFNNYAYGPDDWFGRVREYGFFTERVRGRADLEKLRVIATTSVGTTAFKKPDPAFLDRLWKAAGGFKDSAKSI